MLGVTEHNLRDDTRHYKIITLTLEGRNAYKWLLLHTEDFPKKRSILNPMCALSAEAPLTVLKSMPVNTILAGLRKAG